MRRTSCWMTIVVAAATILLACGGGDGVLQVPAPATDDTPNIVAEEIAVTELPGQFDTSRTFRLDRANLEDPEGLLRQLWAVGIRSRRAWQPLDDPSYCMDILGPTFTVELEADDPRIEAYGFSRGEGRLFCAGTLMEYTITAERQAR
ncbi:MAG TPA: hypothetical protein VFV75_08960 [Candidatus Polarisedimenticolaceae bacterium]|nr:hypothetical protein [Candidatus Polarisedimenticolaceae bacterium]